jgi:preprotein translocase subunit SecE
MSNLVTYVKESYRELTENMTWVSWEEAQKSTAAVAAFTILFAAAVAAADKIFQIFLKNLFELI